MKRPHFANRLTVFVATLVATIYCLNVFGADSSPQPKGKKLNVILFLADDLGWTDLACFGSHYYETPNIDRLARDGMKFTQNYSACTVCSPSRAALMTGKYPARLHITDWIPGMMPENPKAHCARLDQVSAAPRSHHRERHAQRRLRDRQHGQVALGH